MSAAACRKPSFVSRSSALSKRKRAAPLSSALREELNDLKHDVKPALLHLRNRTRGLIEDAIPTEIVMHRDELLALVISEEELSRAVRLSISRWYFSATSALIRSKVLAHETIDTARPTCETSSR